MKGEFIMITIFNRKELFITYDVQKKSNVCELLNSQGIDYDVKTKNISNPSPMMAGSRSRTGGMGINSDNSYEYKIFVKKEEYDKAVAIIKTCR